MGLHFHPQPRFFRIPIRGSFLPFGKPDSEVFQSSEFAFKFGENGKLCVRKGKLVEWKWNRMEIETKLKLTRIFILRKFHIKMGQSWKWNKLHNFKVEIRHGFRHDLHNLLNKFCFRWIFGWSEYKLMLLVYRNGTKLILKHSWKRIIFTYIFFCIFLSFFRWTHFDNWFWITKQIPFSTNCNENRHGMKWKLKPKHYES